MKLMCWGLGAAVVGGGGRWWAPQIHPKKQEEGGLHFLWLDGFTGLDYGVFVLLLSTGSERVKGAFRDARPSTAPKSLHISKKRERF